MKPPPSADYGWQVELSCGWVMWPSLIENPQVGDPFVCDDHGNVTVIEVTPIASLIDDNPGLAP